MSLRFRKTFTIFPGVRLNIAKKSLSVSLGRDGATVNLGKQGVRGTVGLPGSGLSYSKLLVPRRRIEEALGGVTGVARPPAAPPAEAAPAERPTPALSGRRFGGAHSPPPPAEPSPPPPLAGPAPARAPEPELAGAGASGFLPIASAPVEDLTSPSLEGLLAMMRKAEAQRRTVSADLAEARAELAQRERAGGDAEEARAEIARLQDWLAASRIRADFDVPETAHGLWDALEEAFDRPRRSARIWDVTAARPHDAEGGPERQVERQVVAADFATWPLLTYAGQALRFENANGEEILLFPALAVIPARDGSFALIDLRDLRVEGEITPLTETGEVPADAAAGLRGTAGRPPVVDYGRLTLRSTTGLDEEYLVSDAAAAPRLARAFAAYQAALGR